MIFTNIKAFANNLLLAYVSDKADNLEPPTRNHLLLGRYTCDTVTKGQNGDISGCRRWKQVVTVSNQFSRGWLIEYLLTLQWRRKWNVNQTSIKLRTIVLNLPKEKWSLAQNSLVRSSSDRTARVVKVKTMTGKFVIPVVTIFGI